MRILLTGASSFTGYWFAKTLAQAGHNVVAPFRATADSYSNERGRRVRALLSLVEPRWQTSFGDERFLSSIDGEQFDLFCHHAAEMANYRSWDFDPLEACRRNTNNFRTVLASLSKRGCRRLIATGSVFEPYEGLGDSEQRAFNPYGLSKHLSFEVMRLEARRIGWSVGKFVIPNPFGPLEEPRFTAYLAKEWLAGGTPNIATPDYVRDNIHVSLLARAYLHFCEDVVERKELKRATPGGYVESQGAFAARFAKEFKKRTGLSCCLAVTKQIDFPEPMIRINGTATAHEVPEWDESAAWDQAISYYYNEQAL